MQVIYTARMKAILKSSSPRIDYNTVPTGRGISMKLVISHTRIWDYTRDPSNDSVALDFCFEVQAHPETWLIAGQRKGHFKARV